jgi:hypothetical protein
MAGTRSNGATGGANCTAHGNVRCSVKKDNLKSDIRSVTFTVTDITHGTYTYDPANSLTTVDVTK